MGATYSLGAYLEDDSITLEDVPSRKHPGGKAYTFASPSFETGLWLKNLMVFGRRAALATVTGDTDGLADKTAELGKLLLDDDEEVDVYRRVMGDTFEQLRDDDVSWGHVQEVFGLLLRQWGSVQTIDDAIAANEVEAATGEAATQPNRAARRASGSGSSPKAGSKSSRASSGTRARTSGQGSTPSSARSPRSASRKTAARKVG